MGRSATTFRAGRGKTGGRAKGVSDRVKQEVRDFVRSIIDDPQYRENFKRRAIEGTLPSHLEALLFYYTLGKPAERHELAPEDSGPSKFVINVVDKRKVKPLKEVLGRARETA